jgi:hypothetical protein
MQVHSGNLPKETKPYKQPELPPQKYELDDRNTNEYVPVACGSQIPASAKVGIPGRGVQSDPAIPQPEPKCVDNKQQPKLDRDGAQPDSGLNGAVKARQILGPHDSSLNETADHGTYPQNPQNSSFDTNLGGNPENAKVFMGEDCLGSRLALGSRM